MKFSCTPIHLPVLPRHTCRQLLSSCQRAAVDVHGAPIGGHCMPAYHHLHPYGVRIAVTASPAGDCHVPLAALQITA